MNETIFSSIGVRRVIPLVLAFGLMIGCATAAFAQTPAGGQYGDPIATASGNPAIFGIPTGGGSGAIGVPKAGGAGAGGASPGGESGGSGPKVLPATGGPALLPITLGTLALGSAGLLALRYRAQRGSGPRPSGKPEAR